MIVRSLPTSFNLKALQHPSQKITKIDSVVLKSTRIPITSFESVSMRPETPPDCAHKYFFNHSYTETDSVIDGSGP